MLSFSPEYSLSVHTVLSSLAENQVVNLLENCRTKEVRLAVIRSALKVKAERMILNKIQERELGFSHVFSTGIETDLEAADYMDFLIEDPTTRVISCFIMGFKYPKRILEIHHKAANTQKPIIIMKLGRSALGVAAVQSDTDKMMGMGDLRGAAFKQKGVDMVETLDELVETSMVFAKPRRPKGLGIGILAFSEGGASISAD